MAGRGVFGRRSGASRCEFQVRISRDYRVNAFDADQGPLSVSDSRGLWMATITKKEFIDQIAEQEGCKRIVVKRIIQSFLDAIIDELSNGNRLEFRDFGVFESKIRASRKAQNPKTMDKVHVPSKRTVKFKIGRVMKERLLGAPPVIDEATGLPVISSAQPARSAGVRGNSAAVRKR